ncbi:MAG: hypothetical protein PVJ67_00265 [Candidatus Pacearchaeota archaeon]|jgi:hypothetical protein
MRCPKKDCMYNDRNNPLSEEDEKIRDLALRDNSSIVSDCSSPNQMTFFGECITYIPLKQEG